jgi:translation initiation factor IF-3
MAKEHRLDLVEISPNATPPVCRITDYGKYAYEQKKLRKEQKKSTTTIKIKEIQLRPNIDPHWPNRDESVMAREGSKGGRGPTLPRGLRRSVGTGEGKPYL